jgi:hypothetical protein
MLAGEADGLAIGEIIDFGRYPLADLGSDRGRMLLERCRGELRRDGACQLDRLLLPDAVCAVVDEALPLKGSAYRTEAVHNVYFVDVPPDPAEDDVRLVMMRSSKRSLSWRHIGGNSPLRTLYEWDGLVSFLREVLELPALYRDADPDGACSVMFYDEHDELGWHFDNSEFSVTLMLDPSEAGGDYEYVPGLKNGAGEMLTALRAVLAGDRELVRTLEIEPGTLTLFRGRSSLHRVTPIGRGSARMNAVLAYASVPDHRLEPLTRELFYGPGA